MARPEIPLRRPVAWMFDRLVAAYQRWISPLTPPACRFHPSCSAYARDALAVHPLWRALGLTTWRLLRCQPLSKGGLDPVPPGPHGLLAVTLTPVRHSHGAADDRVYRDCAGLGLLSHAASAPSRVPPSYIPHADEARL